MDPRESSVEELRYLNDAASQFKLELQLRNKELVRLLDKTQPFTSKAKPAKLKRRRLSQVQTRRERRRA
jgi:hypothetical protein